MRIIFAGTSDFAVPCLKALVESSHTILGVCTQPDRPAGRGQRVSFSPIKQLALKHELPIYQPLSLHNRTLQKDLRQRQAEIMVVVAYGLILPSDVLTIPTYGCINVHASLLPRWRGASPILHAILSGDAETGITVIQMEVGLDTGAILRQRKCSIFPDDTAQSLQSRLAILGADTLLDTLKDFVHGTLASSPQSLLGRTYAKKINKTDAELNWSCSALDLARRVRAFNPWPVAYTFYNKELLRIWRVTEISKSTTAEPGVITCVGKETIEVATGKGLLRLWEVQLAGRHRMPVSAVLCSKASLFQPGLRLGKDTQWISKIG